MRKLIVLATILALCGVGAFALDTGAHDLTLQVTAFSLLDVIGGNVSLTISTAAAAGDAPSAPAPSTTTYLQYTAVPAAANSVSITVQGDADLVPAGTQLTIAAALPGGAAAGDTGSLAAGGTVTIQGGAAGAVVPNTTLIDSISACYTGTGAGDGANITYTFEADPANIASLLAGAARTITLTYTITP